MQTYNLQVPPTLSELSGSELEHLIVCASKERGGKSVLAEIFAKRFDTKRKINTMVSRINQEELIGFYHQVACARCTIDFSRTYFIIAEAEREFITLRQ